MSDIRVQVHADDLWQPGNPAVNVRAVGWPHCQEVMARYSIGTEDAERIGGKVFDRVSTEFWKKFVPATVKEFYGKSRRWNQEGRSGGWLVVLDFRPVEEWSRPQVEQWQRFETVVKAEIARRCSWEYLDPLFTERLTIFSSVLRTKSRNIA